MGLKLFNLTINRMEEALDTLSNSEDKEKPINEISLNFQRRKGQNSKNILVNNLSSVKKMVWGFTDYSSVESNKRKILEILGLTNELDKSYSSGEYSNMKEVLLKIKELANGLQGINQNELVIGNPKIPETIKSEVVADLKEIKKTYDSGCYRSAIILCGRVLETVLHRKYFEATGDDILEKNPGIGLGKLIAKLTEKNVSLDPGLTQQVHLINQARVFSVHKKQEAFLPSKMQTHAMILYLIDTIEKLF